ncbi:MAG: EAL domain-containing protein [Rubellimicrobium sp.]|nr:EAL domain-containing protein [Rubellimicrobium sp.]
MQRSRNNPAAEGRAPLDPLSHAMASRDADIPALVAEALRHNRAQLAFQPVVAARSTGRVAFHEGFIRLLDPAGRILPAGWFMASVEETALGRDIDGVSLRLGLEMLRLNPGLRLAINMSARSIADGAWIHALESGLAADQDIGARLILEISEGSAMLLPEVVVRFMARMQPRGVSFALDDFGAGLISFRHLKDFFFDMVKIDSLFVRAIDSSPDNQVLTEALVTVARQFEMFTIAEGVETREEAAHLVRIGVDCLQGYLFGRPKPTI